MHCSQRFLRLSPSKNKKDIAGRLSAEALDADVKSYIQDTGVGGNVGAALAQLRKSSVGAKAMAPGILTIADPEDTALIDSRRIDDAADRRWPEELRKATTRMCIWG
ncbi:hypothetical protein [Bradyrhizobium sp. USDA 3458]|uniref:hypothetical protein n=1 Tax=Bradyrhizobium sp. USDA 3458 TaxID=2591461 RepID=UPI001330A040|nr:hypothetical protein [Bradyrhizobium sp. USDA 3458]